MEKENEINFREQLAEESDGDEESPIKDRSCDQRGALQGEPRCVICGRYGEYICDETDDDICSKECKQILLKRIRSSSPKPIGPSPTVIKLTALDECVYVSDIMQQCSDSSLTSNQIDSLRNKNDIRVLGSSVPAPIVSFSDCNLPQKLQDNLESLGYDIPTPIQMQVIPAALLGRNLLVLAQTGSGKTASYLIPIISKCYTVRRQRLLDQKRPLAIVLAPTRELCAQVEEQAKAFGKGLPFKTALIVGGNPMASQAYRVGKGIELIVATPGRLVDLLIKHEFELDEVRTLVIDEVDCMLEKGFLDQVMQIVRALSRPQIVMISATLPREVEKLSKSMAEDIVVITVGKVNRPSDTVRQVVIWVETKEKKQKLFQILKSEKHFKPPAVVFVGSRFGADLLAEAIRVSTGLRASSIHGEKGMRERRESLRMFLLGEMSVIVATGVLGRGMDLMGVRQVIIFDMPNSVPEYVHLIGRASRLGEAGEAIVFVNEEDKSLFKDFVRMLKQSGAIIPRELANSPHSQASYQVGSRQKKRKRS
ncbi:DEAD-box ATP-dependent RNA helicase 41 isoform X2 [Amborella trichopoda]|uniref:DEAD-box ATP-dependent RNA helicase 41 isoform X2 n=1 Tax=Amborella trichopoda TaxID=13333 RepID=UPI0009C16A90|nr:DEAD-box ATP-dependent RNA helicase 41 isoform X2 [Amborella trichopoda]|eukprot:XP_020527567.1 DEAD-box ATP-dependent RNA helicase 41 isoform X2 [Amborella trichopoda]